MTALGPNANLAAMSKKGLLVIDVTRGRVQGSFDGALDLIEPVAGEIAYYHRRKQPVIFACSTADPGDDPRAAIHPELTSDPLDPVFRLGGYSAFHGTELQSTLEALGVTELRIVGLETHTAVLYTAADAVQRGFRVVIPETCVASADEDDHVFALRQVRDVLGIGPG